LIGISFFYYSSRDDLIGLDFWMYMIEKVAELGYYWHGGQTFGVLVVVNVVFKMMMAFRNMNCST
jgi:hypothetical protein